jgi:hypothetical protein
MRASVGHRNKAADHLQAAIRNLSLAVACDDPALEPIADRLIEGTIADKPHLLATGRARLEERRGKGPLPASMNALLRVLDIPAPASAG